MDSGSTKIPGLGDDKVSPGIWERLCRLGFLIACLAGLLRLYGAVYQHSLFQNLNASSWLSFYLGAMGLAMGALNGAAWAGLRFKWRGRVKLAWAACLTGISAYWVERLFLWTSGRTGGNMLFMIGLHLLWVGLVAVFSWTARKER